MFDTYGIACFWWWCLLLPVGVWVDTQISLCFVGSRPLTTSIKILGFIWIYAIGKFRRILMYLLHSCHCSVTCLPGSWPFYCLGWSAVLSVVTSISSLWARTHNRCLCRKWRVSGCRKESGTWWSHLQRVSHPFCAQKCQESICYMSSVSLNVKIQVYVKTKW